MPEAHPITLHNAALLGNRGDGGLCLRGLTNRDIRWRLGVQRHRRPPRVTGFSRGLVDLPISLFDPTAASELLVMFGGGDSRYSHFTYRGSTFAPGFSAPPKSTPEPAPLALLGAALATMAAVRHRRQA